VSRLPAATASMFFEGGAFKWSVLTLGGGAGNDVSFETIVVLACLFVAVVVAVIAVTKAQRRIPMQSAKHVKGRRTYGGTRQFLPLKLNQAGVMPVIFASTLLLVPVFLFGMLANGFGWGWAGTMREVFERQGFIANICFIALIYMFCYHWMEFDPNANPKKISTELKENGSFIPGYRPGKRTAEYLERVVMRITYVGAAFLAIIAVIPTVISSTLGVNQTVASFYGGTSLLIVVSVALDLVQKINSHLVMRNYPGLTED
ncbi:MAG: preprotein translocase subunit SecY, partial [Gemmataceae bacterium]|nr:preprotein translocase subunit SecY [Gemmataceae bacterium]